MSELFRLLSGDVVRQTAIDAWLHAQVPELGVIAHQWFS